GKTTFLRVVTGELYADEGEFNLANNVTVGYLKQNADLDSSLNVYSEMQTAFKDVFDAQAGLKEIEKKLVDTPSDEKLIEQHSEFLAVIDAKDGYNIDMQIKKVLNGMSFPEETWTKPVAVLSGGERTRLSLSKILLSRPDILILDEPTNHLDFETLEWLENHLNNYKGAMIIVSHDRYFLDAVVNRIWEFENQTMVCYKGNYSAFLPQKEAANELQQKHHDADVEKAKKLQDYVDKNIVRASTTKMAQSRRKQLEKMEITEKPFTAHTQIKLKFEFDTDPYNEVLTLKNLTVCAGGKKLIESLDYELLRGEKLIIAGPNGTGKSTLLKVLSGRLKPSGGIVRTGSGVRASYFEQQQHPRFGTVENAIWDKYPRLTELEVRSLLARFGFRGEDVFKDATALSGGELARLRFAEIYMERANLLFLDEPTNHLDIYTREIIGEAL
ncbi:MAG: ABC-F family ATP-binding cassette domain-containing protein, partial [Oscillospiraceae bacterium]